MVKCTDRALTPLAPHLNSQETNTSVNGGTARHTDRAPTHVPMGTNMLVNTGKAKGTDRAPTLAVARCREQANGG